MDSDHKIEYTLGLDLGTNSLGWAIIRLIDGEPAGLVRAGVRIFESGMDETGGLGREESRNKARRDARLQRRQTWRRARRMKKIFNILQRGGLLPPGDASTPQARQELLNELDRRILASAWFAGKRASGKFPEPDHTMPYILRAAALDEPIESHFLGRALYHLAQRRGFLSNRKQMARKGDDEGKVKEGISELRSNMEKAGARTLGDYLSRLKPSEERIRSRWTARDMYEGEFEKVWDAQAAHHPSLLTPDRKKELRSAIFFQRPLWLDPNAVGKCELEPSERRAPAYLLASQRFRLLQGVNNLRILPPGEPERSLTPGDRAKVIQELETKGDRTFKQIRKLLKLTEEYKFNIEGGGETKLKGDRTNADFLDALGDRWSALSPEDRNRLVQYVYSFQNPQRLAQAAAKKWGLDEETAQRLAGITFEPEYVSLSTKAIEKLLPPLAQGVTFAEARHQLYPERFASAVPKPILDPVTKEFGALRNPAVVRSLTQLRKVVNAIIREYGRPAHVRVELARELKKPKKAREAIGKASRRNEDARTAARKEIIKQAGIPEPSPDDIRKFLLAEECRWICPYSGRPISPLTLFGPDAQFEIEHIIPFSISMDNSFNNLTLCESAENRSKHNRTPHQAYSADADRYGAILGRVSKFTGDRATAAAKLRRFAMDDAQLEKHLEDFGSRQLNDTSYASRLATGYLATLYGGLADASGDRRIHATSGQATGYFRSLWQLNSILNDGPTSGGGYVPKSRDDHRHHAVDAVVIGLTSETMIKRLADAAQRAPQEKRRRFASLQAPWPNFTHSVREEVARITVSHRVSRKVNGPLHKETNYSLAEFSSGTRRHRVQLASLSASDILAENVIADPGVRSIVREKLAALGGGDPSKLFSDPANLPSFRARDGHPVPIRRVRIQESLKTRPIGEGHRSRRVRPGANHHVEIYARTDADGRDVRWDTRGVVTNLDATGRQRAGLPVVNRDPDPGWAFRMSISPGETVGLREGPHKGSILIVRTISEEEKSGSVKIEMAPLNDARQKKEIRKSGNWVTKSPNELRKWGAHKVTVDLLGKPSESHD